MVLNINSATTADYGDPKYTIPLKDTDGVDGKTTEWMNEDWQEQWGAFTTISEYQNALMMKGIWNTGKGWITNAIDETYINNITGWGKDTFDDIILNMDVTSMAAGDSYAQIIRDDSGSVINLKVLNPGTIKINVKDDGRIENYQQMSRNENNKAIRTFQPNEIFHLCYNRMADQIHGISIYDKVKKIIKADDKSFEDMEKVMAFQAKPFVIFKMKTDDTTKINTFITKVKNTRKKGDDLFIPDDENLLEYDVIQISPPQIIMEWRNDLRNKFYRAVGLPQIVPGGGEQGTGSESRTIYLAFEQLVAQRQLYLAKQIKYQIGWDVTFNPPTTMADLIGKTEQKTNQFAAQQSEVNPSAAPQ